MYQVRGLAPGYQFTGRATRLADKTPEKPKGDWRCDCLMVAAALTNLVRYADVSYLMYFGLNKLGNMKDTFITLVIVDDLVVALSTFGLFYAITFCKRRTAIPYAIFGVLSIAVQLLAPHGKDFLPTEDYYVEIRHKVYKTNEVIGITSDADVEATRLFFKTAVIASQSVFQVVVLLFLFYFKWPM